MHPSILAQRKALAIQRLSARAAELDPERARDLQPVGIKDAATAEMMFLERLADLLDARPTSPPPAVTTETAVPEPDALPAPVIDAEPESEPAPKRRTTRKKKK